MTRRFAIALMLCLFALTARADDLKTFGNEMTYFYLAPSAENFQHLQTDAIGWRTLSPNPTMPTCWPRL